jgi:S-adenosylmethionine hydrolase
VITLLTDFGLQDIYVGVMKGVIFRINPQAHIVDLGHQLPPQDISTASFQFASAYPYFPRGTVHVVVVDPGVGSQRGAIALDLGDAYLVGPNNGVFSQVIAQYPVQSAVSLDQSQYWTQETPSATFHGRDIFAPVAAHLSRGVSFQALGRPLSLDQLIQLPAPQTLTSSSGQAIYSHPSHLQ